MRPSPGDGPFRPRRWPAARWAPALVALAALACSSGSSSPVNDCSRAGQCGPDDQLTEPMVVACTNDLADQTCGALYQAVLDCRASQEVCLEGGVGRDDMTTVANCLTQLNAWTECQAPPDAGPETEAVSDAGGDVEAGEGADAGIDASGSADAGANGGDSAADAREAATVAPDAGAETSADAGAGADTGAAPEAGSEAGADASPEAAADAAVDARGPSDARAD